MPCYSPLSAWRDPASGLIKFADRGVGEHLDLPCGRCMGCRLERSRQWAVRIMFEAQMHERNSFITLTYSPEHCPYPPSLDYKAFQGFMKRFRKDSSVPLRFFVVGEYGDQNSRPHFHAAIFGEDFVSDRLFLSKGSKGHDLYRSPRLERLWPFGFSSVGELTFDSAAYMARYVLKKVTGDLAAQHYRFVDVGTGEVFDRVPEFCHMSLKPGIGGRHFELYNSDIYNGHDYVVVNGRKCKPPRYFDKLLKRSFPDRYDEVKEERAFDGYQRREDNTDARLAVKEEVASAAFHVSTSKRSL